MSDGHTSSQRYVNREPKIRDATGREVYLNDAVWIAGEEGQFIKAHVVEVLEEGVIVLMTNSSSIVEINFKPKANPSSNLILKS